MHAYRLSQRNWCEIQHAVGIESTDRAAARRIHRGSCLTIAFTPKLPEKVQPTAVKKAKSKTQKSRGPVYITVRYISD